jgi:hypothetical protein
MSPEPTATGERLMATPRLAADFFERLAGAIVAFEMPIDRIEGKFKLGQNRSQGDRLGMLKGLDAENSPDAEALAEFIRKTLVDGGVQPADEPDGPISHRARTAAQHHHLRCSKGHLPRAPGRAGVGYLGSSEIGYSLRVRGLLGAGSRSALPLRFSVIFEYGGLIP